MDQQTQDDQLEPIYNSSLPIQNVALMIWEQWKIDGWRKSQGDPSWQPDMMNVCVCVCVCVMFSVLAQVSC